jgi:hypothetical protein
MKKIWALGAVVVLVLGAVGYPLAQSEGPQGPTMGPGHGMMKGMMGPAGHGAMMGGGMRNMMQGQPLTSAQLEEFARQHGITAEQAKRMTDACGQVMSQIRAPQNPAP